MFYIVFSSGKRKGQGVLIELEMAPDPESNHLTLVPKKSFKNGCSGNSLVVQWLELFAFIVVGSGSISGWVGELSFHKLHCRAKKTPTTSGWLILTLSREEGTEIRLLGLKEHARN